MRPIVLAVIAGLGLAAGLAFAPSVDAATLVKKQKAAPEPIGKTAPTPGITTKASASPTDAAGTARRAISTITARESGFAVTMVAGGTSAAIARR